LRGSAISYLTATNLALFPKNEDHDVELCAKYLGVSLNLQFVFKPNPHNTKKSSVKYPFPTPCSIKTALTDFVDLRGPLRKKMLKDLAVHCEDEEEK
jgi:NADPH-ferrihemoprotein reductase